MRGNLPTLEPRILSEWSEKKIYEKLIEKNRSTKKRFTLPDGPPYANGDLHLGHVLNKVLKDIVIKFKAMDGHLSPFVPGWDCHGLPIELKVTQELGDKRADVSDSELRELCRKEALKWVEIQKKQFQRLGVLADWDNPYMTLQPAFEAHETRVFAEAVRKGLIEQGEKPVFWCWALQTALADAEVEYKEHTSTSLYVKFPVSSPNPYGLENLYFTVWTTTPWTLPANVGLSVHPDFQYEVVKVKTQNSSGIEFWIVASDLKESLKSHAGVGCEFLEAVRTVKGAELVSLPARHPFYNRESKVVVGRHVTLEQGTGVVHTAPGHGVDDYNVGIANGLDVLCPVDDKGCFTNDVPEYQGVHVFKANPLIVERLKDLGLLIESFQFRHSYPHCWRSKTPLIFRTTPQWFLRLDLSHFSVRSEAIRHIADVQFFPESSEKRFRSMIENRPDWCLSRQRTWGVPVPIYYCKKTGAPLLDADVIHRLADLMESSGQGLEAYWKTEPADVILHNWKSNGEKIVGFPDLSGTLARPDGFGTEGFVRGRDILDVWFDSGTCFQGVQIAHPDLDHPADIYLEGSDQHRGWFNTSMISSIVATGKAPFKALVTHGFIVNPDGKKLSKSAGNATNPMHFVDKSGAEILRLWTTYEDYSTEIAFAEETLNRVSETYRRFRNTLRYMLGCLSDFEASRDSVPVQSRSILDRWMLAKTLELITQIRTSYENFQLNRVYHALNLFFTTDLSALYLDVLKDRIYTGKLDGALRRGSQSTIQEILDVILPLMAPILSFTAEEAYSHFAKPDKKESILLEPLMTPEGLRDWSNPELLTEMREWITLRDTVNREIESLRNQKIVGANLECQVTVKTSQSQADRWTQLKFNLSEFFIVSKVTVEATVDREQTEVVISKIDGEKCPRCWHYGYTITEKGHCQKCEDALSG